MQTKQNVIVIKVDRYRSRAVVVTMISELLGKRKALIAVNKKSYATIEQGQEMLIEYRGKADDEFIKITSFEILKRNDLAKLNFNIFLFQSFFCELLLRTSFEANQNVIFYNYGKRLLLEHSLETEIYTASFLYIIWHYLEDIGGGVSWRVCGSCQKPTFKAAGEQLSYRIMDYYFDFKNNQLLCSNCKTGPGLAVGPWFIKFMTILEKGLAPEQLNLRKENQLQLLQIFAQLLQSHFTIDLKTWPEVQKTFENAVN